MVAFVGLLLLARTPVTGGRYLAGIIYGISSVLLFGISALYHVPMWGQAGRAVMRRADHAGIFLMIVGTYTPFSVLAAHGEISLGLKVMWAAAILGMIASTAWSHMPRGLRSALYVALGFGTAPLIPLLPGSLGWSRVVVLLIGALIYIAGALVYSFRRPNPWPRVFGYHEVFHVMVIAAAALQFGVVLDVQRSL